MHKLLSDVTLFHKAFNQPILGWEAFPSQERIDLRLSLIKEELEELKLAFVNEDIVEVADALVDLMYVTNGTVLEFGMQAYLGDESYDLKTFLNGDVTCTPSVAVNEAGFHNLDFLANAVSQLEQAVNSRNLFSTVEWLVTLVEMILVVVIDFCLQNYFYACHDEVQASNMSKLGEDGKPIYRADGKVVKGANFFKPNLHKILNK